jgi:hypothetical protein
MQRLTVGGLPERRGILRRNADRMLALFADSNEVAQAFRDDFARHSGMISPTSSI